MLHILIVDDEVHKRLYLVSLVQSILGENVSISEASSYVEAGQLFSTQRIDLIFIDGFFPRGGGNQEVKTLGPALAEQFNQLGYQGTMIAFSHDEAVRAQMREAGCQFELSPRDSSIEEKFTEICVALGFLP